MTGAPMHAADRRRSVKALLDGADQSMRRGARPGAEVWPTGVDLLDRALGGGMRAGELILLGGSEASGKTTLAMQLLRNVVAAGRCGVVFSFEHESQTLIERLLGLEAAAAAERAEVSISDAGRVRDFRDVFEAPEPDREGLRSGLSGVAFGGAALAATQIYADRLHIHASNHETTPHEIARTVAELTQQCGSVPVVLVDYLQKVPLAGHTGDESSRVTIVAESLKDLALELDCAVIAIAAADRESLVAGRRMRTHDLRGSSALAYEADIVLILSNKEAIVSREHLVYDLGSTDRFSKWSIITVEKNRNGQGRDELQLEKDFEHGRFRPVAWPVEERLIEERVFTT